MIDEKVPETVKSPLTIAVIEITGEEPLEPRTPKGTNRKAELQREEESTV